MAPNNAKILLAANDFLTFINKSPSPFHVDELKKKLTCNGFTELRECEHWELQKSQKYFVTKNQSTIIAFAIGGGFKPGNGFSIVGAHTDSPCLKVKPRSNIVQHGYSQLGVQCYGGGIWSTWFDRDLTLAGQVIVQSGDTLTAPLVNLVRPILRIPHVAIHLQRDVNDGFAPNKENHLRPIISTLAQEELLGRTVSHPGSGSSPKHHPLLIELLCDELNVKPEQVIDFDLCLADTQPAAIGGALDEFIFSPRLDNLLSSYCACVGLLESFSDGSLERDPNVRMISLFDNEEVGSGSAQGAESAFHEHVLRRVSSSLSNPLAYEESIGKSFVISADQAHCIHPNYPDKHDAEHRPAFHKGMVLKFNSNQRYATSAVTAAILRVIADRAEVPLQDWVMRNDMPCGSTIGPIISTKLGIQTVDVGCPQLGMHSIREMADTSVVVFATALFKTFFQYYPYVFESMKL